MPLPAKLMAPVEAMLRVPWLVKPRLFSSTAANGVEIVVDGVYQLAECTVSPAIHFTQQRG